MPEGDTVFRTARNLHRAFAGRQLTASDLRLPQLATTDLTGAMVVESVSRGKHLLLRLQLPADGRAMSLHSHLGMDGSWRVYAVGERWRARSRHLIRVVLRTADAVAVGYELQQVMLVATEDEKHLTAHLGPDLLGADWDPAEAVRRLSRRTGTIADALRDQRNLAGIGNVYCAELLFLRGLWPWTPVPQVTDLSALVTLAKRLLEANRTRPMRTTTGVMRRGQDSYVYGRAGAPCRRCGTLIRRDDQGERVTYWCPHCQPEP
ncbi:Fpg/Nei family DNA glycosylase [Natronosporangium hydrolyticum]|uniref:DNA-(apurinic or apyrimidinic site) lyase n=1 Tax=Natronosporangium hydrolyticum TaxID=2811111 RepID=A0A895YDC5_9ACTN|nr:DNA-formamidopyrimidine glycosylase family protein [Natronosporangium hydrolyticum]QSB13453.1 Fpg/Nei family DNA glycosylase [Natronosporangium hydrolyticum]